MDLLNSEFEKNRLFTYKVAHDGGSAPNPFGGVCTLAICKPAIRRVADVKDIIVGLGCGSESNRVVYVMVVSKTVKWKQYIEMCTQIETSKSHQFSKLSVKVPKNEFDQGDCIWTDADSEAKPSWSRHGGKDDFDRDVRNGESVLFGDLFWYFGKGDLIDIRLPSDLICIIPRRGHRSTSNNMARQKFVDFFNMKMVANIIEKGGVHGTPAFSPNNTDEKTCAGCRKAERESDAVGEEHL